MSAKNISRIATYLPQVGRDLSANHSPHTNTYTTLTYSTIELLMAKCAKGK